MPGKGRTWRFDYSSTQENARLLPEKCKIFLVDARKRHGFGKRNARESCVRQLVSEGRNKQNAWKKHDKYGCGEILLQLHVLLSK